MAIPDLIEFNESIHDIDISFYGDWYDLSLPEHQYLTHKSEHYRLLTYLANLCNNIQILDVGTHNGASALALSRNPNNYVISYDVEMQSIPFRTKVPNVRLLQKDMFTIEAETLQQSSLILLDVSPHDGDMETRFFRMLKKAKYKGLVICDDIKLNPTMEKFWQSVNKYKTDISQYGHFSGSGIVSFNPVKYRFLKNVA